jgi:hypothetical protein
VIYRDVNGNVQVKDGTPAPAAPGGGRDRDAYQPVPYDMHDIDGVVLATVWVPAGATSLSSQDIRDRRLPADLDVDTFSANSVETEQLATDYLYAGSYNGSDADARLDNALAAASDGDEIYLEKATYSADRSISQSIDFQGPSSYALGSAIGSGTTWTLDNKVSLYKIRVQGSVVVSGSRCRVGQLYGQGSIDISGNTAILTELNGEGGPMTVTFQSGTSGGIVDSSSFISVTDSGSNTVGDIA